MEIVILLIFLLIVLYLVIRLQKRKTVIPHHIPVQIREILAARVPYYIRLPENKKTVFEERAKQFLRKVKITGVKTLVEDTDRVLIAASALIPIFNFPNWEYKNLHEVLLYPGAFNHDFEQEGYNRNITGMVGNGAMNDVMILSQAELRQAFINPYSISNPAIHEFVHLVDKLDGEIDGIPQAIMDQKYVLPWLRLMQHEIQQIRDNLSGINPYGATNEAEFFAVVAEYFFEQPALLQQNHPQLFELLEKIFKPHPALQ